MIHLVLGGSRSGKSAYAEKCCLAANKTAVYLATSPPMPQDELWLKRIKQHQQRRQHQPWTTLEEPLEPAQHKPLLLHKAVLIECLTLWLHNFFQKHKQDAELTKQAFTRAWDAFRALPQSIFVVGNEMSLAPHLPKQKDQLFVELNAEINHQVAQQAQTVTMLMAGLPLKLK